MLDGKNALIPFYYSPIDANEDNYKNFYKDKKGTEVGDSDSFDENMIYYELIQSLRV
jgi:hypothetical protein